MLYDTNGQLASFLNQCRREVITHDGVTGPAIGMVAGIIEQAVRGALIEFPYVQAVVDAAGKSADPDANHRGPLARAA